MMVTSKVVGRCVWPLTTAQSSRSLVFFRQAFGLLMAFGALRLYANGWLDELYLDPFFRFPFLEWQAFQTPSVWSIKLAFVLSLLSAIGIGLGRFYKVCLLTFFASFTYLELLDKTNYLNHYYLVSIVTFLLILLPEPVAGRPVPRWVYWVLRLQFGLVYFYAGIAKFKTDWLFEAQPLRTWLQYFGDWPIVGTLFVQPQTAYLASWSAALFDVLLPFALIDRRSRPFAFLAALAFHGLTGLMFPLGLFPFLMILGATLFFDPDWPKAVLTRVTSCRAAGDSIGSTRVTSPTHQSTPPNYGIVSAVGLVLLLQIALPLRHHLLTDDVLWTEHGLRFAWHVMVMEKTGTVSFRVTSPDGRRWVVYPGNELSPRQTKMMATQPDMILYYAKKIGRRLSHQINQPVTVEADSFVALNGCPVRRYIDNSVDLLRVEYDQLDSWLLPRQPCTNR